MNREETSISADDELLTASTSQSNSEPQQPKKGILKRPSIASDEQDKLAQLGRYRPSPERFPDKRATRIPKLQVTWWEKNAVAFIGETSDENNTDSEQLMRDLGGGRRDSGPSTKPLQIRQTAILDSEDSDINDGDVIPSEELSPDLDDSMTVASSTGCASSAVVGRWWTGKDTRYIPHCEKKGCNHRNNNPTEYVTPTQRKNREIAQLRKELKQAITERDEKEKHLSDLREKVKQIEVFNESHTVISDGQRQMRKEQIERDAFEKERKILEKKHAVRVNQLVQETMTAREEAVKLGARVAQLEESLNTVKCDTDTQTDYEYFEKENQSRINPPDPGEPQSALQVDMVAVSEKPSVASLQHSPLVSPAPTQQQIKNLQDALNHMQAYQNEVFIWRNKAAQLEIVAKDQIAKINNLEDELEKRSRKDQEQEIFTITPKTVFVEDASVKISDHYVKNEPVSTECMNTICMETKANLKNEIDELNSTFENASIRIRELEDDVGMLRKELESSDELKNKLDLMLKETRDDLESKAAELAASLNTANRLQQDKDNMHSAIDYMEERMQVYRNTLLENEIVVSDEKSTDWRRTITGPRYSIMNCKLVQTSLTAEQLSEHESEFINVQQTLQKLEKDFQAKNSSMADKFREVKEILLTKTDLVETLTKQLEDVRREQSKNLEKHQEERDTYKRKLEQIGAIAEKVPILEQDLSNLNKEKNEMEMLFKKEKEDLEDELARMLDQSLAQNKSEADHWEERINAQQIQIEKLKNDNAGLLKSLEDAKMESHIQTAELETKLKSSIDHIEELQAQINKPKRDIVCQAAPRQVNKYVGCKPNVKSKETQIVKGDLYDDVEERLKVCNIELETTRRQVDVLQDQLMNHKDDIKQKTPQPIQSDSNEETKRLHLQLSEVEEKLANLERNHFKMTTKLQSEEEMKNFYKSREKKTVKKMMEEFESFRDKLTIEMNNYKKEKEWLQFRISNLEADNSELQKIIDDQSSTNRIMTGGSSEENVPFRKALSEADVINGESGSDADVLIKSQDENVENVTASQLVLSQQPFSQLSDVLNIVQSDLEHVLTQIDQSDNHHRDEQSAEQNSSNLDYSTNILKDVMSEWAQDEKKTIERQLKRCKEERDALKSVNDNLSKDLQLALAELSVYRHEKPHKIDEPKSLERSSSFSTFSDICNNNSSIQQNNEEKWKNKSGILFREVNRIRKCLAETLDINNELRYQLAIARGERELSQCLEKTTEYPLSPSLSYHTANDLPKSPREKDDVIIHEPEQPFQLGSSRASLSCSIMMRSQSVDRKSQPKEEGRRRSRSVHRKPPVSKDELNKREKRREQRLHVSASRSSSMTSLYLTSKENSKLPIMSQSWNENAADGSLPEMNSDYEARKYRVVSLREKVGRLSRENKDLQAQLNYINSAGNNPERLSELEKETEELKLTVKDLLKKVSFVTAQEKQMKMLQDELNIRRQESAMYEKKIIDMEEERKEMYLLMFKKGQQAANLEMAEERQFDQLTEDRITLKFLHDAFYYYLLNRGDSQEHLAVIMTMLGFSANQKSEVLCSKRGRSN